MLIVALGPIIVLSHLARGSIYDARCSGTEFLKICFYYLVVVAWIDKPARMRKFLLCLCACAVALTCAALLQYFGKIDLPALRIAIQGDTDPNTGESIVLRRLCGAGIFHDPAATDIRAKPRLPSLGQRAAQVEAERKLVADETHEAFARPGSHDQWLHGAAWAEWPLWTACWGGRSSADRMFATPNPLGPSLLMIESICYDE